VLWERCEIPLSAITTVIRHRKIYSAEDQLHAGRGSGEIQSGAGQMAAPDMGTRVEESGYWRPNRPRDGGLPCPDAEGPFGFGWSGLGWPDFGCCGAPGLPGCPDG
jgi:hypothetical protein